ncbi:hypothetical protein [Pseudonocardia broussonetiae]|uniref:VOC family protein n=1 Tax=Pseudonocardia broussonetiae TaxID=2736640 RepID=A0A6M6JNI4_9PSEU|nr:hypothetical protein [Pseudonocardia broussonetiae]QJY48680.1 hypothetical protein HOP40_25240 [Pseudonocardia broussonetiae]
MTERTVPLLPCRDIDDVAPFYAALGFTQTYRQSRPNPYLCVVRGGIDLHFFAVDGFDPAGSMGSALLLVDDTGALFDAFADGLRTAFGRLPVAGIPRITRPRRRQGTAAGFTVVDPGGNWLRVSRADGAEPDPDPGPGAGRLERVLQNAARQGDARGDDAAALAVLDAGLARHPGATDAERLPLLAYRAELLVRTGDDAGAAAALAAVAALDVDAATRARYADELAELGRTTEEDR